MFPNTVNGQESEDKDNRVAVLFHTIENVLKFVEPGEHERVLIFLDGIEQLGRS